MEQMSTWFLGYKKEFWLGALVFVVATLSFALGYIANQETRVTPIIIEKCSPE